MSEFKHTPGDWIASGHEVWATRPIRFNLTTAGTPLIATVAMHDDCEGGFPYEANVHLIAAAPDLLEACQTFAEWLRREEDGFPAETRFNTAEGEAKWREWFDENLRICDLAQTQANAAIAKAQGGAA